MDSASLKILTDLFVPVLMCYAAVFLGFLYIRHKLAKGRSKKTKSALAKIVLWISIGAIVAFFIGVSQLAGTITF